MIRSYQSLFVGIDVSKYKHDIAIVNEQKQLVAKPFVIKDNRDGYHDLIELTKVAPEIEKNVATIQGKQLLVLLAEFPTAELIANSSLEQLAAIRYDKNN